MTVRIATPDDVALVVRVTPEQGLAGLATI